MVYGSDYLGRVVLKGSSSDNSAWQSGKNQCYSLGTLSTYINNTNFGAESIGILPTLGYLDPKIAPKWSQNGPKMVPKWSQNGPNMVPTWSKITPKWSKKVPSVVGSTSLRKSRLHHGLTDSHKEV